MIGKVKWFSIEKGYGFVTDEHSRDHYFSVQAVQGADLPAAGDQVQFQSLESARGFRASDVRVVARGKEGGRSDDRVACGGCGKKMVPRIISYQGVMERSVCPFCGVTYCSFPIPPAPRWPWFALAIIVLMVFVAS